MAFSLSVSELALESRGGGGEEEFLCLLLTWQPESGVEEYSVLRLAFRCWEGSMR